MKKPVLLLVLFLTAAAVFGQTKNDDILKLLKISGTEKLAEQMMEMMIQQFRQMFPEIPAVFWNKFKQKLDIDSLLRLCVPAYNKHYSHDEIKQLIQFYETPLGRKVVEVTPLLTQETMIIGQNWGEKLGQEIVEELMAEGYF